MQCLCGQRLCFECGATRSCAHVDWESQCYDNIMGYEYEGQDRLKELANISELQVNMRSYLDRTRRNADSATSPDPLQGQTQDLCPDQSSYELLPVNCHDSRRYCHVVLL